MVGKKNYGVRRVVSGVRFAVCDETVLLLVPLLGGELKNRGRNIIGNYPESINISNTLRNDHIDSLIFGIYLPYKILM